MYLLATLIAAVLCWLATGWCFGASVRLGAAAKWRLAAIPAMTVFAVEVVVSALLSGVFCALAQAAWVRADGFAWRMGEHYLRMGLTQAETVYRLYTWAPLLMLIIPVLGVACGVAVTVAKARAVRALKARAASFIDPKRRRMPGSMP